MNPLEIEKNIRSLEIMLGHVPRSVEPAHEVKPLPSRSTPESLGLATEIYCIGENGRMYIVHPSRTYNQVPKGYFFDI